LRRIGKKKSPSYHIVAADSRSARTGKFLEVVGRYEPVRNPALVSTKEERLFYWLGKGALPTDTVRSLLRKNGSWMKWALTKKGVDGAVIAGEMEKWQMLQTAKRQREQERKAQRLATKKKAKKTEAAEPAAEAPPSPAEASA
jgi:small subunit ribosomal protein S16